MNSTTSLLTRLGKNLISKQLPLRVRLWDGSAIDLGPNPTVVMSFKSMGAAMILLRPTMDRLAKAYVEGQIDLDGPLADLMQIAEALNGEESRGNSAGLLPGLSVFRHTRRRDARSVQSHYDVSNEFYSLWLDRNMVYSCAYFRSGDEDLHTAQEQKLDHICRKLRLRSGERLLDIGCGWGGLITWAAKHYGVKALGVTLSREQFEYATERVGREGLIGRVEVRLQDYRDIPGEGVFDKISSVGMFEHVGLRKLPVYFGVMRRLLKENGLVLNHGITTRDPDNRSVSPSGGRFIEDYVFPDGELPHLSRTAYEMEAQDLEVLDMESLRPHYAQTLMHWVARLQARRDEAVAAVGEKRYRIWLIYMAGCAHAFERGWISVNQLLATKQAKPGLHAQPWTREYQYVPGNAHVPAQPSWQVPVL